MEEELEAFFTFHSRPTSLVSMVFSYPDSIYTKHDTDWENKREAKGGPDPTTRPRAADRAERQVERGAPLLEVRKGIRGREREGQALLLSVVTTALVTL